MSTGGVYQGGNGHQEGAWPEENDWNAAHRVLVCEYDEAANPFTVLDSLASGPIQVSPEQLADDMKDTDADVSELIRLSPTRYLSPGNDPG